MTLTQQIVTIALCVLGTQATRLLPFLIFSDNKPTLAYMRYLGKVLQSAIFAVLIVYCLKNVNILSASHGLPELLAIAIHLWKKQMLLSIAGGMAVYMLLVQQVFLK